MESNEPPLMKLSDLTKQFENHVVLQKLNFEVRSGQHTLIKGPSGCGKTTLLRCMALLEPIQSGTIEFEGRQVLAAKCFPNPDKKTRLNIGIVFQNVHLWPHLSVLQNICLPLRLQGNAAEIAEEKSRRMLADFGLAEKLHEYPNFLSGGQQQRVALARAFVHSPKLLLLDEIMSGLDDENADKVMRSIATIAERGATIVIVSHAGLRPSRLTFETANLFGQSQLGRTPSI